MGRSVAVCPWCYPPSQELSAVPDGECQLPCMPPVLRHRILLLLLCQSPAAIRLGGLCLSGGAGPSHEEDKLRWQEPKGPWFCLGQPLLLLSIPVSSRELRHHGLVALWSQGAVTGGSPVCRLTPAPHGLRQSTLLVHHPSPSSHQPQGTDPA